MIHSSRITARINDEQILQNPGFPKLEGGKKTFIGKNLLLRAIPTTNKYFSLFIFEKIEKVKNFRNP